MTIDKVRTEVARFLECVGLIGDMIVQIATPTRDETHWPFKWLRAQDLIDPGYKLTDGLGAGMNVIEYLLWENDHEANIYVAPMPRTHSGGSLDGDVLPGRSIWADIDHVNAQGTLDRIKTAQLPVPTMITNSGHGSQVFYLLKEPPTLHDTRLLVGDIGAMLGGCKVHNLNRFMRLPPYANWKELTPATASIVDADPTRVYSFETLRAIALRVTPEEEATIDASSLQVQRPTGPAYEREKTRAAAYMAAVPGIKEGDRDNVAFRKAAELIIDRLLTPEDVWPLLQDWNLKNIPPMKEHQLRAKLSSAMKYAKHLPGSGLMMSAPTHPLAAQASVKAMPVIAYQTTGAPPDLLAKFQAEARGEHPSVPLPWPQANRICGGLRPNTVMILAGAPGSAKTTAALEICLAAQSAGEDWAYIPLEESRTHYCQRMLGMLARDWSVTDDKPEGAQHRIEVLERYRVDLEAVSGHIHESLRAPISDGNGDVTIPSVYFEDVINRVKAALKVNRVVIVDPLSQIDSPVKEVWVAQSQFIRRLVALVSRSGGTLILIAHLAKRPGTAAKLQATLEDIQGSADLGRLVQTVLLLEKCRCPKPSTVYAVGVPDRVVSHTRKLVIEKARNNEDGLALAFNLLNTRLVEEGVIRPRVPGSDRDERVPY